ncbi:MAG: hypothetical protein R3A48_19660 [Polyangiales bacterium]
MSKKIFCVMPPSRLRHQGVVHREAEGGSDGGEAISASAGSRRVMGGEATPSRADYRLCL